MPAEPAESENAAVWNVALPLPLPRLFDYRPVSGQAARAAEIGCRVRVPFGTRELTGVIAAVAAPEPGAPAAKAGELLDAAPLFAGELLESLRWLAR